MLNCNVQYRPSKVWRLVLNCLYLQCFHHASKSCPLSFWNVKIPNIERQTCCDFNYNGQQSTFYHTSLTLMFYRSINLYSLDPSSFPNFECYTYWKNNSWNAWLFVGNPLPWNLTLWEQRARVTWLPLSKHSFKRFQLLCSYLQCAKKEI